MNLPAHPTSNQTGFTLIELIIVIIITGILAAVISPIMSNQFQAYTDSSRRATLVQEAQSVMQQLERDFYYAVPNSTIAADQQVELLALSRSANSTRLPSARYDEDDVEGDIDSIRVFGCITDAEDQRVVIASRVPEETLNSYDGSPSGSSNPVSGMIEQVDQDCTTDSEYTITLSEAHDFEDTSSFNRLYLTQGKITYTCSASGLTRQQDFGADQAEVLVSASPFDDADACEFERILGGTFSPPGLLVRITLSESGESVTLARIFQLVNAP